MTRGERGRDAVRRRRQDAHLAEVGADPGQRHQRVMRGPVQRAAAAEVAHPLRSDGPGIPHERGAGVDADQQGRGIGQLLPALDLHPEPEVHQQNLEDDSKEAMLGEHGTGMIHLAQRAEKGASITDMQYRFGGGLNGVLAKRIGIEKHGDSIAIFVSLKGEPMHQFGPPITLHFDEPFYVGIGFCSHLPATVDAGVLSNVMLENSAGKVR